MDPTAALRALRDGIRELDPEGKTYAGWLGVSLARTEWIAIRAALDQIPAWQPIETAPRDSTRVLVYCQSVDPPAREVFEAWWRMPYEGAPLKECWWCYDERGTMLSADVHRTLDGRPIGATGWMPLPDPLVQESKVSAGYPKQAKERSTQIATYERPSTPDSLSASPTTAGTDLEGAEGKPQTAEPLLSATSNGTVTLNSLPSTPDVVVPPGLGRSFFPPTHDVAVPPVERPQPKFYVASDGVEHLSGSPTSPEPPIDNGNIYIFCDFVDTSQPAAPLGCIRGAGHNGPHAFTGGGTLLMPVLLWAEPPKEQPNSPSLETRRLDALLIAAKAALYNCQFKEWPDIATLLIEAIGAADPEWKKENTHRKSWPIED